MILTFSPLKQRPEGWERWPSRTTPFRASYSDTLTELDRELTALGATYPILQVDVAPGQVRLDGQLRADARVNYPGVILSFETKKHGTLTYPCNAFDGWSNRPGWHANLRAIALGLKALRQVERYGIADRGQQYAGYAELGSGIALGAGMTVEQAAKILAGAVEYCDGGDLLIDSDTADMEMVTKAYRDAVKVHHPDAGGDPDLFRQLTEARDLLEAHS